MMYTGVRAEEFDSVVDVHGQHITDALVAPGDCQCFRVEAPAITDIARHFDIRQEAHLDGLHALTFTTLAASACCVEREPARCVAANARLGGACINAPDLIPEADVSRGA